MDRFIATITRTAIFAKAVVLLLAGAPLGSHAQTSPIVHRIGYIQTATPDEQLHLTKAFEDGLRALGYVEGRNIVLERRFAWGNQERLPELAAELVSLKVDVIVTGGNPVIAAVKQATTTIPVVMAASRDPVRAGFLVSVARPGGNITGLTNEPSPEILGKLLALLKEAIPGTTRAALLLNPTSPGAEHYKTAVESAASKLGMTLHPVEVRGRDELEGAFATIARQRPNAIVVLPDPVLFTARSHIATLASRHRLPTVHLQKEHADLGGLISYGSSLTYQFRRAAAYVDRILKGAKPGDLPVEQPTEFELVINMKTAKALGLTIPPSMLLRADHVIE